MKNIVYLFLAGLLGALNWCNTLFIWLVKGQSFLFGNMDVLIQKGLRILHILSIKEIRKIKKEKTVKSAQEQPPVVKTDNSSIVGGTKTVFITELPVLNESKPIDSIELPLEDPEEPEEMEIPDVDEFEMEPDTIPEDEKRMQLEESLYNNQYDDNIVDPNLGGVSIQDMEQAYRILHKEIPVEEEKEEVVVNVLNSLNGTDMFKMLIDTEESDLVAKSIMDRYIEKHNSFVPQSKDKAFNIDNFLE